MQQKSKNNILMLVMIALLVALDVVMSRFLSINSPYFKLDTSFVALAVGAYLYGPIGGMIIAGMGDFIGAILFPFGVYMPHFTISAALSGLMFGFALKGKFDFGKVCFAVIPSQIVCSLILNSIFLIVLYGNLSFWIRLVQTAISTPIQLVVIYPLIKKVVPQLKLSRIESSKK